MNAKFSSIVRLAVARNFERACAETEGVSQMKSRSFTAVVEQCPTTGLFVGYIPGLSGAHSQGATMEELQTNLREVIEMLLEDGEPDFDARYVGTQIIEVPA